MSSNATGTVCPQFLEHGVCADERAGTCLYEHAVLVCMTCRCSFAALNDYQQHNLSAAHLARVRGAERKYRCTICTRVIDALHRTPHVSGQRHLSEASTQNVPPAIEPEEVRTSVPNHEYCSACDAHLGLQVWDRHVKSVRHIRSVRFSRFLAAIEEGAKDREGVSVSKDGHFGIVDEQTAREGVDKTIQIQGDGSTSRIRLVRCVLAPGGSM